MWFRKDLKYSDVKITAIKYLFIIGIIAVTIIISYKLLLMEISRWGDDEIMEYFISQVNWRTQGGSVYLTTLEYTSLFNVVLYMPLKFIHFTFGPFLWTSSSPLVLLSALESLIGTYFFISLVLNYKYVSNMKMKKSVLNFIILFSITGLLSSAIFDSNYGTAMRHRMVFMPLIFVSALLLKDNKDDKTIIVNRFDR